MTKTKILLSVAAASVLALNGCGGGGSSDSSPKTSTPTPTPTPIPTAEEILMGTLFADKTLTADTVWKLDGKVVVPEGVTLTIEPGTKVAGVESTDAWLMVMPGGKLIAEGTAAKPILFTSEAALNGGTEASGQWGGVTIIGNSDNDQTNTYEVDDVTEAGTGGASSGSLKYVTINNTGIAVEANKEINGLSLFGVSASTTVENITVNRSGDDGIEIWGGDVNLKNIVIDQADDDSFDTDSGWAGSVDGLTITNGKKAGIEMSGTTVGTYKNVNITLDSADSEGGLYFKAGDGEVVGGVFENVTVNYNSDAKGAITVSGAFDDVNTMMTNVTLSGSNTAIVGKTEADTADAAAAQAIYDAQATTVASETLMGPLAADKTLTADTVWKLDGKVVVPEGVTLTIEPGTKVAGVESTDAWLMVMPGGKLIAEGTAAKPILFTSEAALNGGTEASGQWGGVTIIGNSDNDQTNTYEVDDVTEAGTGGASSGSLKYVTINNTGIAVEANKEINGLSLFGVSASTTVENITVNRSGDDGIEIWGGDVNLKNIVIDQADDDSFDTDSGWAGSVDGLTITNGKKAGIEMSGTTVGTYKNVNITLDSADSEGGLYFKAGDGEVVGGVFENVTVNYNSDAKGAITVSGAFDDVNTMMTNVTLSGSNRTIFAKTSPDDDADAAAAQAIYDAQ
ncbi:hypothetical protein [Sulfurovum sp.]|uniref:hypothetical protein n=1 Tax=Sulfurovum sp. TaxID=1969726 RepID=UPI002A35DFCB|nr:hypothetical protein [Sulfurovum sp.]MDY0403254.1 hypothetical protein [Sulfurovum sp.]